MADPSKSEHLQIRVSPAEKSAIQQRAKHLGLDMSSYVLSRVRRPRRASSGTR